MSNEKNSQNKRKLCESTTNLEEDKEISSKRMEEKYERRGVEKDNAMLSQLKSLISNPTPGIKSNFNNNITQLSKYIERYKLSKEKEISLANESNDPLKHEDLKEGIKRARFIKLQTEKKEKLCPTIFNSPSMNAPSEPKSKASKLKSSKSLSKFRHQVSS